MTGETVTGTALDRLGRWLFGAVGWMPEYMIRLKQGYSEFAWLWVGDHGIYNAEWLVKVGAEVGQVPARDRSGNGG